MSFALAIVFDVHLLNRLPSPRPLPRTSAYQGGPRLPEPSTAHPQHLAGVRVLVVEDDPDSLDALRFLLERNGAEVHCAVSAEEGRETFARRRPDIVISDLSMPGEDGYSFLASVRALTVDDGGKVPALAFSAMSPGSARSRAHDVGFQVFLRKPEDVPLIVPTVLRLLPAAFSA